MLFVAGIDMSEQENVIADLDKLSISDGRLYITGVGFLEGIPSSNYGLFRKTLCFSSPYETFSIPVGSISNAEFSKKYGKDHLDCTTVGFSTFGNKGIDLNKIPFGDWMLSISVEKIQNSIEANAQFKFYGKPLIFNCRDFFVIIKSVGDKLCFCKRGCVSNYSPVFRSIDRFNYDQGERILDIYGNFIVRGQLVTDWGSLKPYLIVRTIKTGKVLAIHKLGQALSNISGYFNSEFFDSNKSAFATFKNKPVKLGLITSDCELIVTCFINGLDYSSKVAEYKYQDNSIELI